MMKKLIFILLSVCLWGSVSAQTQLKIMSFNIHAGYDAPMANIAAFIKAQDPDIVALQEVEYYTNRSGANNPRTINNNIKDTLPIHNIIFSCDFSISNSRSWYS